MIIFSYCDGRRNKKISVDFNGNSLTHLSQGILVLTWVVRDHRMGNEASSESLGYSETTVGGQVRRTAPDVAVKKARALLVVSKDEDSLPDVGDDGTAGKVSTRQQSAVACTRPAMEKVGDPRAQTLQVESLRPKVTPPSSVLGEEMEDRTAGEEIVPDADGDVSVVNEHV